MEPAFSHEVCGEAILEELLVLEGVVKLAVGHAAAFEPAIKDIVDAAKHTLALLAGDCEVVYLVPMQVRDLQERAHAFDQSDYLVTNQRRPGYSCSSVGECFEQNKLIPQGQSSPLIVVPEKANCTVLHRWSKMSISECCSNLRQDHPWIKFRRQMVATKF